MRTCTDRIELRETNGFGIWFRAVRFHYVPPSFLPAVLGSLIAWSARHPVDVPAFLLVVIGVTINHCGLNMLDDVCDYLNSIDRLAAEERNPYTGGSGVLTDGLLQPRQLAWAATLCFMMTVLIGVYLTFAYGWPVLILGLFGLFCSVFYALPPIKLGYRGLGELGLLVNFGPIIGLGAYYVQSGTIGSAAFLVPLVLGVMMWSEIVINEIPDYEEDLKGGKMNLVVRAGRKNAVILYTAGLVMAYLLLLYTVISGIAPPTVLAGLISLPFAFKSVRILRKNYLHRIDIMPANLAMIKVHLLTGFGMIVGYLVFLFQNGRWV